MFEGSPAQKAGLKGCDESVWIDSLEYPVGGDVLMEADGVAIETIDKFSEWSNSKHTASKLKIYRNGSTHELTILPEQTKSGVPELPFTTPTYQSIVVKDSEISKGKLINNQDERDVSEAPSVGVVTIPLTNEITSAMGLPGETQGSLVIRVLENSIAEKAGIRAGTTRARFGKLEGTLGGDIIIGVEDGAANIEELEDYISHYHVPGTQIKLKVLRNGSPVEITLVY